MPALCPTGRSITAAINCFIDSVATGRPVLIKLATGRYDFYPDSAYLATYYLSNTYNVNPRQLGILVKNKRHILIDGQGSAFIFHGYMQPTTSDNSENITLQNICIDWDKPFLPKPEW
jgi:hypothetical protein